MKKILTAIMFGCLCLGCQAKTEKKVVPTVTLEQKPDCNKEKKKCCEKKKNVCGCIYCACKQGKECTCDKEKCMQSDCTCGLWKKE